MSRLRDERGATLIMIIGVIAALAILAAAMTALLVNVQHNTATTRTQTKAFSVAEAGLDAGQAALWVNWPADAAKGASLSVDPTSFEQQFSSAEFPAPKTGQFIDVKFYDDNGDTVNPGMNAAYNYDYNDNGNMWIVSRGATGSRAAKVQVMVHKVKFDARIRDGVALYTEGVLTTKGTGNDPVIGLDLPAMTASAYARGGHDSSGSADIQGGIMLNPDETTTLNDIFPDTILEYLVNDVALPAGKVYNTQADVPTSAWSTDPRIIVIKTGGVDLQGVPETGPQGVWGDGQPPNDMPGMLIVLSGDMDNTGQQKSLYGIVYLVNGALIRGNAQIHGMLIAKGSADLRGTRAVNYNVNAITNLNGLVILSVKQVPNTWRELNPNLP